MNKNIKSQEVNLSFVVNLLALIFLVLAIPPGSARWTRMHKSEKEE